MIPGDQLKMVVRRAADRLLGYPSKLWLWGDSIGLEGLLDAAEMLGDERYAAYVYGLLKGWLAREQHRSEFDYNAAGVALLRCYQKTGDAPLLDAARRHATYLASFRTTAKGAFVRYENAAIELPPELPGSSPAGAPRQAAADGGPCVFVDSMHFDGPFYAKLYEVTGEACYRSLALANILPQIELLWDPEAGLFHHFWMEREQRRNGVLWGRGNGWGLLGVALTREFLGGSAAAGGRLEMILRRALPRLVELQDELGAWHTVLDDPASYLESSTAAFFADVMARAVRLGLFPAADLLPSLEKALAYALQHVNREGLLEGVSYETFPSTRVEHYRNMPRGALAPWGQGPLLAAAHSYNLLVQQGIITGAYASL